MPGVLANPLDARSGSVHTLGSFGVIGGYRGVLGLLPIK